MPNHPTHLGLSLVGGGTNAPGVSHGPIVENRQGGWHETVNIRIGSLAIWNEIANEPAGMRLARIRALQADPAVGGVGLISGDRPTNIFFFIEVHSEARP